MDTIYLICLLVGGFFVLLSIFGGSDADAHADGGLAADLDHDHDFGAFHHDAGAGPGFVDLLSIRTLFLFAAFFGLTGVVLSLLGTGEPLTAVLSVLMGLVSGLGGNYLITRFAYANVSSDITEGDLKGVTAKVIVPFEGFNKGKISVVARGNRIQLVARSFGGEMIDVFKPGDEVVVVRMDGSVAEVVKPE